ncbi:uncharacterized protein METZ01_LOCUS287434, partial [marine metagenome]
SSSPTISGCIITGNSTTNNGGGIVIYNYSDVVINSCTITNNSTYNEGGGICCYDFSSVVIANSTISNNQVTANGGGGGGISLFFTSQLTISGSIITSNSARNFGGGINLNESDGQIENCTISDNYGIDEQSSGGGVNCYLASPNISNSIISGNSAGNGGGLSCQSSDAVINNVVFNDNVAWFYGGAILCNDSSPIMENTTISQNTSDGFGGGISCETNSHPIVLNSIFWNNEPHEVYFMNHSDANSFSISYSRFPGEAGTIVTSNNGAVYWGDGNINSDPLFCEPDSGDYTLAENSPCLGTGENGANMGALGVGCGGDYPPTDFSLSGPANNTYITIDESNMNTGHITFWWSEASDANGDSLYYQMRATSSEIGNNDTDTNATAIDISYMDIIEDMSENNVT